MDTQLETTRSTQKAWSNTAGALKARYEGIRRLCFILSILAALLAAAASQLPDYASGPQAGAARLWLSILSASLLAIVGVLTHRFLGVENSKLWLRARVASEALKRAAYTYAAQAAPYNDPATRGSKLAADRQLITKQVEDLLRFQAPTSNTQQTSSAQQSEVLAPKDYVQQRVEDQMAWYEKRAQEYDSQARRLRGIELILVLISTVITAIFGAMRKTNLAGLPVDFVALTAVLTTLSGAILAYVEASKLDFIVTSYRSTASQLRDLWAAQPDTSAISPSSPVWSDYVRQVETVLATENGAWMTKLGQVGGAPGGSAQNAAQSGGAQSGGGQAQAQPG
jgi:SMODS and SLOG-associating 2TM effector domain 1/Protein of unknown function (DUF4231)